MSYTNTTEHYKLPQYTSTDAPTFLSDFNSAMATIDTTIHNIASTVNSVLTSVGSAETGIEQAQTQAADVQANLNLLSTAVKNTETTITTTQTDAANAVSQAQNAVVEARNASSTAARAVQLATSASTLTNSVNAQIPSIESRVSALEERPTEIMGVKNLWWDIKKTQWVRNEILTFSQRLTEMSYFYNVTCSVSAVLSTNISFYNWQIEFHGSDVGIEGSPAVGTVWSQTAQYGEKITCPDFSTLGKLASCIVKIRLQATANIAANSLENLQSGGEIHFQREV